MKDSEVLEKAAEYIEEHGWCRFVGRNEQGAVCAAGSVFEVLDVRELASTTDSPWIQFQRITTELALRAEAPSLSSWNDNQAKDEHEVTELMRSTAKDWANQNR